MYLSMQQYPKDMNIKLQLFVNIVPDGWMVLFCSKYVREKNALTLLVYAILYIKEWKKINHFSSI